MAEEVKKIKNNHMSSIKNSIIASSLIIDNDQVIRFISRKLIKIMILP